jgi:cytochrome c peroxidase
MSLDVKAWILCIALTAVEPTVSTAAAVCPQHLRFLQSKCVQWQSYLLPESVPPARGNAFADNEAAAALGMKIFYDNRFSRSDSGVACVSCHDPEHAFAEQKPTSHTIAEVARNAPDLLDAAWYTRAHFWDGKVDNLWSAPLFTFEQPDEMGSSRLSVVHTVASIYKVRYEKVFGPLPDLSDRQRFPPSGKPGTPQFDAMSAEDKNLVNHAYANVGKALEAYVRKVAAGRSRFDDFLNGSAKSIKIDAQRGMVAFTRNGCDTCHSGPTFTDQGFHNLGLPGKAAQPKDPARAGGMAFARQWQFTATGPFADPTRGDPTVAAAKVTDEPDGFRTPSLRNVALTPPYGHDGSFATLEQVIDAHARVLPKHAAPDAQDKHDIVELLRSLSGRPPQPPWNYWPGG